MANFDTKGAKSSIKSKTTNFYKSLFKNILLHMNGGLSKIRSLHAHTYVMYRMFYFERYCTDKVEENSSTKPFKALHAVHSVQPKAIIRVKRWQMVDMIYILLFFDDIFAKFLLSISENVKYQYNFFLFYPFCII